MASKLDELMALADEYASECAGVFAASLTGEMALTGEMERTRTALQSALKAVVEDAERYKWLRKEIDGGAGVALCEQYDNGWSPIAGYCTEFVDAARKP